MEPALLELYAEGTPDDEVAVLLRLSDPTALPDGVRIIAQFGPIATCRLSPDFSCAVQRHGLSAGANPARQLSLQPVAIGAVAEVTKRLKPLV